jgi:hypothetical protein
MADKNFSTRSLSCLRKTTFKEKALGREAKSLRRGERQKIIASAQKIITS